MPGGTAAANRRRRWARWLGAVAALLVCGGVLFGDNLRWQWRGAIGEGGGSQSTVQLPAQVPPQVTTESTSSSSNSTSSSGSTDASSSSSSSTSTSTSAPPATPLVSPQEDATAAPAVPGLVVPPSGDFDRDFAARAARFEQRCANPDPTNPFLGFWSDADIAELCSGTLLLSNFFNSKPGYQRVSGWGTQQRVSHGGTPIAQLSEPDRFKHMQKWYDSVQQHKLCAMIFHDTAGERGEWYERERGTKKIRFKVVDPSQFDKIFDRQYGLNDVRAQFIHQALCATKAWKFVFYSDIFDVTIGRSPVGEAEVGLVYAGFDSEPINCQWMEEGFRDMGGPYHEFWKTKLRKEKKLLWSAGLLGGDSGAFGPFLAKYLAALTDPNIAMMRKGGPKTPRSHWGYQNVNMPALNYVCERFYAGVCRGGAPFNSRYRKFEVNRKDVWFIHK